MNATTIGAIAVGAVILGLSLLGARHPTIHPTEQRVFRAVNGLPDWLYWLLRDRAEAEMSEAAETIGRTSVQQEGDR